MKLVRTVAPSMMVAGLLLACGGDDSKTAKAPQTTAGETYGQTTSATTTGSSMTTPGATDSTMSGSGAGATGTGTMGASGSMNSSGTGTTTGDTTGSGSMGSTGAMGATNGASTTTYTDAEIAAIIAAVNTGEIEEGKLAQKKAKDAKVKRFAAMMVNHHTTSTNKQVELLKKMKMTPSENSTSRDLTTEGTSTLETLKAQSGADFDKAYIDAQVREHQKALSMLDDKLIPQAKSAELKTHLQSVRATVDSHLREAMDIQKTLGMTK